MALTDDLTRGEPWPPHGHRDRIERQELHELLYRNRRAELVQTYSAELLAFVQRQDELVPYPSAKIAARTLAAFLFGEDPQLSHDDDAVQTRHRELAAATNLPAVLLESAVTQGTEGEVYVRAGWDRTLDPRHAIVTGIPGRQVIPVFRQGRLLEAVVVTVWADRDRKGHPRPRYWRHLEYHEPGGGTIRHRLFYGPADNLGEERTLTEHPGTAHLSEVEETDLERLLIGHVPLGRDSNGWHGVSLFDGIEDLVLAVHRLYSQEQHDAELARRRVAVTREALDRRRDGSPVLDRRLDLFVLADDAAGAIGAEGSRLPVQPIEFSDDNVMRERIRGRIEDLLIACGISPKSIMPDETGGAVSGTSRKLAQALTLQTAATVARYWQHQLAGILGTALAIEARHLGGADGLTSSDPDELAPSVALSDGLIDDARELAEIVGLIDTAEAASTETKVRMLHPEWDDPQVDEEVRRIEGARPEPPPPPGVSAFGNLPLTDDDEGDDDAAGSPDGPPEG